MNRNKVKQILNLVGELNETLLSYFEKSSMTVITRDQASNYEDLDYILVSTGEEAKQAAKDFSAEKHDIQVVCLGQVKEVKDFLLYNGRLIIEPEFVESQLGEFILNKFFNKNYNIHLDESFSTLFSSPKEFKITNHLAVGLHIDEVSNSAFKNGFNIVALRSFMDHVIYYFTYLKQAGLAGVPYEVEYDNNENFFVVNIYCPVRNFVAEYMIDSFGSVNSKDPLQYLLGVVAGSTDFLEVTYIENPGRLVLTAAWGKDEKKRLSGLSFNNVLTTAQTIVQLEKKVASFEDVEEEFIEQEKVQEQLRPQSLPGSILEMVVSTDENSILNKEPEKASNIVAFAVAKFEEEYPDKSINDIDEEEFQQIINDYPDEDLDHLSADDLDHLLDRVQKNNITQAYDEEIQRVREDLEDEDEIIEDLQNTLTEEVSKRVAGHMDADTLNRILGGHEDEESSQKLGGSKEDVDDFVAKIGGGEEDNKKGLFTTNLGSSFESKAGEFNVRIASASPEEKKKQVSWLAKSAISDAAKKSGMDFKVQSFLEDNASKKIESELERYAAKMGQSLENLSEKDIITFKNTELPQIVESVFEDEASIDEFKTKLEKGFDSPGSSLLGDMGQEFETKFKEKLENKLETLDFLEKENDKYVLTNDNVSEDKMQELIQVTMKETMDEEFKLEKANKDEIEKKEKEIIENLSTTMKMDVEEVKEIVKEGTKKAKDKEVQTVVDNLFKEKPGEQESIIINNQTFGEDAPPEEKTVVPDPAPEGAQEQKKDSANEVTVVKESEAQKTEDTPTKPAQPAAKQEKAGKSLAEAELIKKLKKQEQENKQLQQKVKAMEVKLQTSTAANSKVDEVKAKAKAEAEKEVAEQEQGNAKPESKEGDKGQITQMTKEESEKVSKTLESGEPVSSDDAEKIHNLLKKEQEILQLVKGTESSLKKVQIEAQKQEILFKSEIEKANRTIKGKDIVVEKLKESMGAIVQKKEIEIKGLSKQVEDLNKRLKSDESIRLKEQVRTFRQDAEVAARTAEMYKGKLESYVKSKKANEKADNSAALSEENRQLKGLKTQMENKVNSLTKENRSWEDRYNKLKELENKFRSESTSMKGQVKDLEYKLKAAKDSEARITAIAEKAKGEASKGASTKEVEHLKGQITQLQGKLKEMADKQKSSASSPSGSGASGGGSAKEKHLEKTNKMLQTEITKARGDLDTSKKEMMKMKGEATGLKNKIKTLEREVDKLKKAKGAGKKAA